MHPYHFQADLNWCDGTFKVEYEAWVCTGTNWYFFPVTLLYLKNITQKNYQEIPSLNVLSVLFFKDFFFMLKMLQHYRYDMLIKKSIK